jgi:hypothetical protein
MKRFAFVLLLVFGVAPVLCGQAPKPNADTPKEGAEPGKRLDEYIEEYKQKSCAALAGAQPAPKNDFGSEVRPEGELFVIMDKLQQFDEPSRAKVLASFNEYLDYRISGYQHRREVFKWQLFSSKITFYVVILLVLAGVYFSGIQFHRSLDKKRAKVGADKVTADQEVTQVVPEKSEVTEITASIKGIRVSSPVLGVLILVISLAFFYLYLSFVYPIQETF